MNRTLKRSVLVLLALIGLGATVFSVMIRRAALGRDAFISWASGRASPVDLGDSVSGRASLRPLTDALATAKVVGLGESSHGAHEFAVLRTWIIQNLADSGLTDVIFEAPLPTALAVDAYVQGGPGDAETLLHELGFWIHENEAVVQLVEWLRTWNQAQSRRIHFRGMDHGLPVLAMRCLHQYAASLPLPDSSDAPFLYAERRADMRRAYTAATESTLHRVAAELRDAAASWRNADSARLADPQWRAGGRCLEVAIQVHARYTRQDHLMLRDSAMAINALAWLAESGPDAKAVVWAHNGHVALADQALVMGRDLRASLGAGYTPVALLFDRGQVLARRWNPAADSLRELPAEITTVSVPGQQGPLFETALDAVGPPAFFLDLRSYPRDGLVARYLDAVTPGRDVGEWVDDRPVTRLIYPYRFGAAFDWLLFIDSTSASRLTPSARRLSN